ncbi:MAG TPA: alpha/beta hydrolase [Cytophagales bacterium]|jgi:hypothetical protein|nr:alpha/beta hydrolase [Cytophagales bacterium]
MKEIYLLSGLGADKRVFDFLKIVGFKLNFIEWVEPVKNETIENYSKRITHQIKTQKPILIGVSFGGIISVEIGKLIETEKIILISSASSRKRLPQYFKLIGFLSINKIIPIRLLKSVNQLTFWFFGAKKDSEKELLHTFIKGTNEKFLSWAIDKIVNWQNVYESDKIFTIHGAEDRLLPINNPDYKIERGGHLMIIDRGEEISEIIMKLLTDK